MSFVRIALKTAAFPFDYLVRDGTRGIEAGVMSSGSMADISSSRDGSNAITKIILWKK